jgi:hypothetical protein
MDPSLLPRRSLGTPPVLAQTAGIMSCPGCGADGAGPCRDRKHAQLAAALALLARMYPSRRFGAPDDAARFGQALPPARLERLRGACRRALAAPAALVPGSDEELCDYIYVLCVGREPSLLDAWRGGAVPAAPPVLDRYLRVAVSSLGPLAFVQEVELRLDAASATDATQLRLRETVTAGVREPALLPRYQRLVALLARAHLRHLDVDVLARVPEGYDGAGYTARFGTPPTLLNYLFYPWPPQSVATEYL